MGAFTFEAYLGRVDAAQGKRRAGAKLYWGARVADLPPGPALPLACDPDQLVAAWFMTRQIEHWRASETRRA